MKMHSTFGIGAIALGLLLAFPALAADEYQQLLKDKKFAEVEKAASAKLAKEPSNAEAMIARTGSIIGIGGGVRIDEAVKQAEQCVTAHPNNGGCHLALGKAMGSKAIAAGIMSSLGSAGTIRDSFKKAVELNPNDFEARFSLLEYYIMAPFVVGGGAGKAEALAKQSASVNAEGGKLMMATIDLHGDNLARAESATLAGKPGADHNLVRRHESLLASIGAAYVNGKKLADANRVVREAQKKYPDNPDLMYVMARVHQEQGQHRDALAGFEQVLAKTPLPHVHYRMGKSLQALGEKARAVSAFEKAVSSKGLGKQSRADAEEQIKALKI
ncbi:MAG: tetratricopeptide repeat protein [Telluria sp.]